jgi:mono/diheme cytochrome c family protein
MRARQSALGVAAVAVAGLAAGGAGSADPAGAAPPAEPVDFARQIRPILSRNCLACHGPDEKHRKAGLRLDTAEGAFRDKDGTRAFAPGKPAESEALRRLTAADPDDRMPPPDTGKALTAAEVALVRRWVEEGAPWRGHWAFEAPRRPSPPASPFAAQARNDIDLFVGARLAREGLRPAPLADPHEIVRRLSLDLVGLPPAPEDVDAFARDPGDRAYEALVDKYLASPAYGERWARPWLDLARYADSKGYEKDRARVIWRYRDWVIEALNRDLPYDEFTIHQLAGDLLDKPTPAQRLATAFHRNTLTNDEGGTDDEEFRVAAVKDRVDTTLQAWMGLTAGCAKCHEHKYDPLSQREYYRLYAFFNQTEDADKGSDEPVAAFPTAEQERESRALEADIAAADARVEKAAARVRRERTAWEGRWLARLRDEARAALAAAAKAGKLAPAKLGAWKVIGPFVAPKGAEAAATEFAPEREPTDLDKGHAGLAWSDWEGGDGRVSRVTDAPRSAHYLGRTIEVGEGGGAAGAALPARTYVATLASHQPLKAWLDGKLVVDGATSTEARLELAPGKHKLLVKVSNVTGPATFLFRAEREEVAGEPLDVARALATPAASRSASDRARLRDHHLRRYAFVGLAELGRLDELRARRDRHEKAIPRIPILRELAAAKRRTTHIHARGNFLEKGEAVEPGVPAAFHPLPGGAPANRLGLARWLVDPRNPLTARVLANRIWAQLFGAGLVETEEDFGHQGLPPSHPELLDWLATEAVRLGWSQKALIKTIVMSATYRQSSRATPALIARDRWNRLLARGPRFRLEAEMVRDAALAAAGLLSRKLYGPSVMPPQPEGIWAAVYSGEKWVTPANEDRHRRGLYTWIRRTSPYPSMITFDAPSRETCTVRRIRSNTPLQALVTLNDPVYVEAAQALARRMLKEADGPVEARIALAFRLAVARPPSESETRELARLYEKRLAHYRAHRAEAQAFATEPLGPLPAAMAVEEAAALTAVANVILNLDEFLTKG